jgi:hypothetical protein
MVSTHKANANAHPGQPVLDYQQHRRTKKQIHEDNAQAEAAACAKEEEATAKHRATIKRIAELEDMVAVAEEDIQTHAQRPDLFHGCHIPLEPMEEDNDGSDSEGGHPEPGTGDFAEDNSNDPGLAHKDELEENSDFGLSDDESEKHDIPACHSMKRKGVSRVT